MKIIILALCFTIALTYTSTWRVQRSTDSHSVEEKIEEGYELLKNEPGSSDTKDLLLQLNEMKAEIEDELTLTSDQKYDLTTDMKEYKEIEFDHVKPMGDTIMEVNEHSHVDMALYQGDIMLTKEQSEEIIDDIRQNEGNRAKRQARRDWTYPSRLWLDGVFYSFHNASEDAKRVFRRATEIWKSVTCLNFTENDTATDRIVVIKSEGCWSFVGKRGGIQRLSLGDGCEEVGTAVHEIGHALGFYHTHSRHDRNKFIILQRQNFVNGWLSQFTEQTTDTNYNYGLTYDYGSVMHYGARSASKNGRPIMVPRHDMKYLLTLGSDTLAFYDILMMNHHYGCFDPCGGVCSSRCENGGVPHPRNCSKCLCPSGYAGDFCTERPPNRCGATLEVNSTELTLTVTMGNRYSLKPKDEFKTCDFWLQVK